MKKIITLLFLLVSVSAFSQSLHYTPLTISATGSGSEQTVSGSTSYIDSIWTVLQSTHLIASTDVLSARKIGATGSVSTYARGKSVLWPYQVASAFSSSSVTSGAVVLPSGSLGTVAVAQGGTGAVTLTTHSVLFGQGTSAVANSGAGTAGQFLASGGASSDPVWTTTLPLANGGTAATTFSGAQTSLGFKAVVMSADSATTGQTLIGTPLQFTIGTTDVWDFDIYINPTNSGTNGTKVGILLPASATMSAQVMGNTSGITAFTTDMITASNTASANFNTSTATADVIWIHGTVTGGGTAGAVVLQFYATTSGTATIKAKSYITAHRIS